jgi:hypothetical protein
VSLTNEDSIERAYGRKYGEATAYLLKYRKVQNSEVKAEEKPETEVITPP